MPRADSSVLYAQSRVLDSMSNPTPKQILVRSLKSLHKARVRSLFKVNALRRQKADVQAAYRAARQDLKTIQAKMTWEINTNGKILKDKA